MNGPTKLLALAGVFGTVALTSGCGPEYDRPAGYSRSGGSYGSPSDATPRYGRSRSGAEGGERGESGRGRQYYGERWR